MRTDFSDYSERDENLDYTARAYESFYEVVDDPYFLRKDQNAIYEALKKKIRTVPFGDYLKRYIYEKAQMEGDYRNIPLSDYQTILCNEFSERQTSSSFSPTTARLRNLAKNWLQQRTVNRRVILLLGFGLGMSVEDVNDFLTKAIKEQRLNARDPFEVICWFCYRNGYSYIRFEKLLRTYEQRNADGSGNRPEASNLDSTSVYRQRLLSIQSEAQLFDYLASLPIEYGTVYQSRSAREQFDALYREVCDWVAEYFTEMERNRSAIEKRRLEEKLERSDRYFDFEKQEMLQQATERYHLFEPSEIKPVDIEQLVFSSVPKDQHGNLFPLKLSSLFYQFSGSRLSRQHITDILNGNGQITRYDLLTLNFFVFYKNMKADEPKLKRYAAFIDTSNAILDQCGMGPVYPVNPYECFLMMCVLSEDPAGTFSDVWEMSYAEEA